jgi:DNA-binding transcriptional regulator YiaG
MSNKKRAQIATPAEIVLARRERTQVEVAEMLGVSRSTIQNWEYGNQAIPKTAWMAIQNLK